MAKLLKLRRGTTSQHSSFTGAEGEVTVDTDKETLVVHDGSTAGGHPVAAEDMANVSSASIAGRLGTDSIATTKIAAGALPTDVTVADANISGNLTIANADVNSDAAIAGTKISPDFGSQNVDTTGNILLDSDSNKLKLGDDEDLQIYHNGSNSVINDSGTGNLELVSNGAKITLQGGSDTMANFIKDAGVELHYDNSKKLETLTGGVDITGNITVSGTVDGRDVAADGSKLDNVEDNATADQTNAEIRAAVAAASDSNVFTDAKQTILAGISTSTGVIVNGVTATTQSAGDASTKVATTAYTDTAVSNLVDSSPSALNTLNELAAALGDDANFSTTVTNSIATKMPLSGGTFTGAVTGTTIADGKGDLRKLALNAQSGNYTLVASDAGKFIRRTGGNVTVPNGVFSTGDMVTILNDAGSSMTVTQGSSFSLINTADAASGNRTITQRGMATILFNASNQGYISGSGLE